MLLLLLDLQRELAAELLDLLGAGQRLVLVLDAPVVGVGLGLDQLTLQVEAGLGLFLELTPDRLQLGLDRVQLGLERRATLQGETRAVRIRVTVRLGVKYTGYGTSIADF